MRPWLPNAPLPIRQVRRAGNVQCLCVCLLREGRHTPPPDPLTLPPHQRMATGFRHLCHRNREHAGYGRRARQSRGQLLLPFFVRRATCPPNAPHPSAYRGARGVHAFLPCPRPTATPSLHVFWNNPSPSPCMPLLSPPLPPIIPHASFHSPVLVARHSGCRTRPLGTLRVWGGPGLGSGGIDGWAAADGMAWWHLVVVGPSQAPLDRLRLASRSSVALTYAPHTPPCPSDAALGPPVPLLASALHGPSLRLRAWLRPLPAHWDGGRRHGGGGVIPCQGAMLDVPSPSHEHL